MKLQLRSSLRHQIIWASLLCLIIPFTLSLYLSNVFTKNLIEKQATTNASESLKLIESQLISRMGELFSVANNIEFDTQITPFLKNPIYSNDAFSLSIVGEKLTSLTQDKLGVYVTILTPDKRFFSNYLLSNQFYPTQIMDEPWFSKLDQLATYENLWVGLQPNYLDIEKKTDPYVITFARTLRTSMVKPYAYVVISISERRIRSLFSSYTEQNMMLLDRDGTVISGREHLGEHLPYYEDLMKDNKHPIVTVEGIPYLYVAEGLPYDDWTLVSLMPYNQATISVNRIYRVNFIWQIGFVAVFIAILIWFLRRFTKPVVRLGRVVSTIEAGNLSIRSEVRGSNEIGKLGRSLDHMLDRVEAMVEQIKREQEQARKAELSMLQAQISPHFLFNILNSIRMRIMLRGDRENADLISSLSQLLRMTIQRQDKMVTLNEEVMIVKEYLKLMKTMARESFHEEIKISQEAENELVPRFILQPIIENALIHGFQNRSGTISIDAYLRQESLVILIEDDGRGMTPEELSIQLHKLEKSKTVLDTESSTGMSGIGLANVYHRLFMLFGSQCSIQMESTLGSGTRVTITLPLIRGLEL